MASKRSGAQRRQTSLIWANKNLFLDALASIPAVLYNNFACFVDRRPEVTFQIALVLVSLLRSFYLPTSACSKD
jgi:hypothetical protein